VSGGPVRELFETSNTETHDWPRQHPFDYRTERNPARGYRGRSLRSH